MDKADISSQNLDFLDPATFQENLVDALPKTWNVVSISLSKAQDEIHLSRIRSGECPFLLKIPIKRQQSVLEDEDASFTYLDARTEIGNIIDAANRSSKDGRDLTSKAAKSAWWDQRNDLDDRLGELLTNMENIWLGGYRGILSSARPNLDALSRFHQTLQASLNRHLPSRRSQQKAGSATPVALSTFVLELFASLGPPNDTNDIDDQILDLLYFVVDIFQFQGERNAYDEVDFDSVSDTIAVRTLLTSKARHRHS